MILTRALPSARIACAYTSPLVPAFIRPLSGSVKLGNAASAPKEMSASVKENVDKAIKENDVVVFGKSWCSFSRRAKAILEQETKGMYYQDIDELDEEDQIQAYLRQLNGQGTVPHIYIRQQFVGGCSDLTRIPKPKLKEMIAGKA